MTGRKMLRLLLWFNNSQLPMPYICVTGGGELAFEFNSQLPRDVDATLRAWGFIYNVANDQYIYRPR